jgi:hypothetical protein
MRFTKQVLFTGVALAATGLISCSNPKPECTVGQSGFPTQGFAVRYILKDNPSNCPVMTGEIIGMQSYHPSKEGDEQVRDFSKTRIAMRTQSAGELYWMIEDWFGRESPEALAAQPNAIGDFDAAEPDASDFCHVPTPSESRVTFPGVSYDLGGPCTSNEECVDLTLAPSATCQPAGDAGEMSCFVDYAPTEIAYRWSNVEVYVTAQALGTQFKADVEIEINQCTAKYTAVGMWPAIDCTDYTGNVDAKGNVVEDPTYGPDQRLCNPEPDPEGTEPPADDGAVKSMRRVFGSGINPDFGPTQCDASVAVHPVIDQYYLDFAGFPRTTPLCTLATTDVPALSGYKPESGSGE